MKCFIAMILITGAVILCPASAEASVGKLLGTFAKKGWQTVTSTGKVGATQAAKTAVTTTARTTATTAARSATQTVGTQVLITGGNAAAKAGTSATGLVLSRLGVHASGALTKLTPSGTRKLADLSADLARSPHRTEWLTLLRTYGDEVADFLWQHKGAVLVGTTATAAVLKPADFLQATGRLSVTVVSTTGTHVVKPMVSGTLEHVAAPMAKAVSDSVPWTLVGNIVLAASGIGVWWYFRQYWKV